MKTEGTGLLSGLRYEPAESCSTPPQHPVKLSTADLLRMTGNRARQDRIIAELEARWILHFVIPENTDTATH